MTLSDKCPLCKFSKLMIGSSAFSPKRTLNSDKLELFSENLNDVKLKIF